MPQLAASVTANQRLGEMLITFFVGYVGLSN
ncbi:MAG: hypothetical protein JWQ50_1268 [Caballeronia mineralivorans]|jgi:hypothetical protein|nr:hypothetical protein [Caballeronia mineralivorans]